MKYTRGMLACILFATSNATHYDNAHDYSYSSLLSQQESAWRLLEELIIKQPKNHVNKFFGIKGATLLASGGMGILGYSATKSLTVSKAWSLGTGALASLLTYNGIKTYLLEHEEHRQLAKIMKRWELVQDKVPQEVRGALATLNALWETDVDNYEEEAENTLTFLKVEIHSRYPHNYRNEPESFFTSRNLQVRLHLDLYKIAESLLSLGRHALER